jgi:hybrid cluster-associated redox disulfide protein
MITKDMLIIDILQQGDPEKLAAILQESGMHCLHCLLAHGETLEQAAAVHGIDVDELLNKLNAAL